MGYVHFIAVDFDYYDMISLDEQNIMMAWIENDLNITRNEYAAKINYPFVIVISHLPIYCSYNGEEDIENNCYSFYGLREKWDSLWFQYKVDLMISGHINSYER